MLAEKGAEGLCLPTGLTARGQLSACLLCNAAPFLSFPGLHQSHPECPAPSPAHQVCLDSGVGQGVGVLAVRLPVSRAFGCLRPFEPVVGSVRRKSQREGAGRCHLEGVMLGVLA